MSIFNKKKPGVLENEEKLFTLLRFACGPGLSQLNDLSKKGEIKYTDGAFGKRTNAYGDCVVTSSNIKTFVRSLNIIYPASALSILETLEANSTEWNNIAKGNARNNIAVCG